MYIMYKDAPVLWFDDSITGEVTILDKEHLPIEIGDIIVKHTDELIHICDTWRVVLQYGV